MQYLKKVFFSATHRGTRNEVYILDVTLCQHIVAIDPGHSLVKTMLLSFCPRSPPAKQGRFVSLFQTVFKVIAIFYPALAK